jgi:hypothetical protein
MKIARRKFLQLAGAIAPIPGLPGIARAQTYPLRPITMIAPLRRHAPRKAGAVARLTAIPDTRLGLLADPDGRKPRRLTGRRFPDPIRDRALSRHSPAAEMLSGALKPPMGQKRAWTRSPD